MIKKIINKIKSLKPSLFVTNNKEYLNFYSEFQTNGRNYFPKYLLNGFGLCINTLVKITGLVIGFDLGIGLGILVFSL